MTYLQSSQPKFLLLSESIVAVLSAIVVKMSEIIIGDCMQAKWKKNTSAKTKSGIIAS